MRASAGTGYGGAIASIDALRPRIFTMRAEYLQPRERGLAMC